MAGIGRFLFFIIAASAEDEIMYDKHSSGGGYSAAQFAFHPNSSSSRQPGPNRIGSGDLIIFSIYHVYCLQGGQYPRQQKPPAGKTGGRNSGTGRISVLPKIKGGRQGKGQTRRGTPCAGITISLEPFFDEESIGFCRIIRGSGKGLFACRSVTGLSLPVHEMLIQIA